MRQAYLTDRGFRRRARRLLDQQRAARGAPSILGPGTDRDSRRRPARGAALLVIDMQEYFLRPDSHACVPGAERLLPGVTRLVGAFRRRHLPVFFTRHLNTTADARMLARWWADLVRRRDPRGRIAAELDTAGGTIITKTQYDAFHGTSLERELRAQRVKRLVICGVVTHLCCETTARAAFVRGYEVIFPIDASAAYGADFHLATLRNLGHGFAWLTTVAELLDALEPRDVS